MSKRLVFYIVFLGSIAAFFASWNHMGLMILFTAIAIISHIFLTDIETRP